MEHLIAKVKYKGNEYYYAYITGGVFGSGTAEEFQLEGRKLYSVMATDKRVGKSEYKTL